MQKSAITHHPPLVSILIPAYNCESWLGETIQCALDQTWENKEVIVVNDGSTDRTQGIIDRFPGIITARQPNRGGSAARNHAFSLSKGDFIQYLDADDLLAPDKIEKQIIALQSATERHIASGPFGNFIHAPGDVTHKPDAGWKDYSYPLQWLIDAAFDNAMFPPVVWLTPRHIIEEAGPWNEELSYNDDSEFFARVLLKSKGIVFTKDAWSYYRRGIKTSVGSRKNRKALQSRLQSLNLVTRHMMSENSSLQTRNACACQYHKFIFSIYPQYPDLYRSARENIKELNPSIRPHFGKGTFRVFSFLLGWKAAKWIRYYYYKMKSLLQGAKLA